MGEYSFEHSVVDTGQNRNTWSRIDLPGSDAWGAVTVADFDGDGRQEFTVGGRRTRGRGFLRLYDYLPDVAGGTWTHRMVTDAFRPGVGAAAADWDGDGRPEFVSCAWDTDGIFHVVASPASENFGDSQLVTEAISGAHDMLADDLDGDGRAEVIAREKDGTLAWFEVPDDPSEEWIAHTVAEELDGDGTVLADLSAGPWRDIVTNRGWFEYADGEWVQHPLVPDFLDWDPETRISIGDLDGDGLVEVVLTESEMDANARLAVLSQPENGPAAGTWDVEIVLGPEKDYRAMHSLQVADLDGDGSLEVFVGEMENGKTDGVETLPEWFVLEYVGDGSGNAGQEGNWERTVLLDDNFGTHSAHVADVDGDGRLDIVGKVWRANETNGVGGLNHVDALFNRGLGE